MSVKLNLNEQAIVNGLPEAMRQAATDSILAQKTKTMERVTKNRSEFSSRIVDDKLIVYGLGNRFPVTLRKAGWTAIINHVEDLKAQVAKLK